MEIKYKKEQKILENEKKSNIEEYKLNSEFELNKIKNQEDKEERLFENEFNKNAQLMNQELEKKQNENLLNIMMAQMIMAQQFANNNMN